MTLDQLDRGQRATVLSVDWAILAPEDAKRLQAMGLDQGAHVAVAHRGVFGGVDPLTVTVGRMTVAVRRVHAAAMTVEAI
ncbi:ferrous iron transport protein A [Pelagerythrobacter rhizovicinus]|jgi:ferrous iron transport protein A|uniref:Ferrous iron transport protein A n=2 Tax=Pelagerythrobacter rhizovicinus TaxID=2268576 RepID=A0A4V1QWM1_9SPHN|nr:FeoA family protein [Pelagerythrobacter rhizovicinus]RXZ66636.1 ferrous iron transport protein A [Pelagerythrobacter rhizovicinus]